VFLMLTDGISEVPNANDEEFGLDRLEQLLRPHAARPVHRAACAWRIAKFVSVSWDVAISLGLCGARSGRPFSASAGDGRPTSIAIIGAILGGGFALQI